MSYGEEFSETEKALCDSNAYNAERIISAEQYNFMFIAHSIAVVLIVLAIAYRVKSE